MATRMQLQKKVSVARLVGKMTLARVLKEPTKEVKCGIFAGVASGTKKGTTDFGDWTALTGQFRAISPDGETMDSGVCFLPDVALDMVVGQLDAGAQAVEFAFEILAVEDEGAPSGFSYRAVPLMAPAEDDAMTRLLSKVQVPQLAAPAAEAEVKPKAKK